MNNTITANDLKVKGISAIEQSSGEGSETIITVRGKEKYVIITKEEFGRLRECELTAALIESEKDLKDGKYHTSLKKHLKDMENV